MRIALIQTNAAPTPEDALRETVDAIRVAAGAGAGVVATQELFLTPYFCREEDPRFFDLAEPVPGPTTEALCRVAAEAGTVVVASLFEDRGNGLYHNTAVVIDADGRYLGCYRKAHIPQDPGFEEKFFFTPGDTGFRVWDTRAGRLGVLVCWDQWFPEAARLAALQGARVLIYPTAIGWLPSEKPSLGRAQHHAWRTVQQGHAVANGCYLAAINRVGVEGATEFWGQSFVADFYGRVVAEAPVDAPVTLHAELNMAALAEHRRMWPFFRDRRIDAYKGILSLDGRSS